MIYHMTAFLLGFILDTIIGDPYWIPHPVRFIGRMISFLEGKLLKEEDESKIKRRKGFILWITVCLVSAAIPAFLLLLSYSLNVYAGVIVEAIMTCQVLAAKCLKKEAMKVYGYLDKGNLEEARKALSMIVGRDTENLSEEKIIMAAVETVAENTSDGVASPMFFTAIGGPVLGFFYKAINTMDSMIGYKNKRYIDFGRFAAKADDVANFIPSRLCAWLMIFACLFLGKGYDARNAKRIYLRDRFKHESPNSAQTESTCAGALKVRLAGPASYCGIIEEKPYLGDPMRAVCKKDIKRSCVLLYSSAIEEEIILLALMALARVLLGA